MAGAVVFDVDGTLVDTYRLIFRTLNDALEGVWGRRRTDREIEALFGPTEEALILGEAGEKRGKEILPAFYENYRRNHAGLDLYPGVREVLETLKDRGVPMGVLTNKGRTCTGITLEALGVRTYFQALRTGTEGKAKPHPGGLRALLEALGADPSHSFLVGDSASDIRAGRGAGVRTVAALWGRPRMRLRLEALAPDVWAEHPQAVLEAVFADPE